MSIAVALVATSPGMLPILFGWFCGALLIVAVFLLNRRRFDRPGK